MESATSYMLIFRDTTPEAYDAMPKAQLETCLRDWYRWYGGLAEQGTVRHANPLQMTGRVVSGDRGERIVDGPFAEAKEAIGGYFLLSDVDLEEATRIARECPNLKYGMQVEVRPVSAVCPIARRLGWTTMHDASGVLSELPLTPSDAS